MLHPSYAAYLGESMKEMGMTPDQIPLKAGIFGAEAWSEEMRQDIQNTLGIKAYDIYGPDGAVRSRRGLRVLRPVRNAHQ